MNQWVFEANNISREEVIAMNNCTASAPVSTTTPLSILTPEQKANFADFWTARGWDDTKVASKLVIADSAFESNVIRVYNELRPTAELPSSTVDAILETIESAHTMTGNWDWKGKSFNQGGYGLASVYKADGAKSSIVATRLVYRLITGITVQPRRIEVLDHINHDPAVCTDRSTCCCILSVNPVQLARVTNRENLLRSNGKAGAFYEKMTHCSKGHFKQGMENCPPCKSVYDYDRKYGAKLTLLSAAA